MFNELDVMFLDEYDYEKTKEKVFDVFKRYEKARFQFIELSMPKITTSYDINYECPESKISRPTERTSFLLLDKE